LFDDTEQTRITGFIQTHRAGVDFGEKAANRTRVDALVKEVDGLAERLGMCVGRLDHPERNSLGAAGTDTGQTFEFADEGAKRSGIFGTFH
jgi:hypothetical protein